MSYENKENILDFKELSEEEKERYIEFLTKNNIIFEKKNSDFCATIKLKRDSQPEKPQSSHLAKKPLSKSPV